eukprot:5525333-Prymnesium_polylepis.1
MGVTRPWAGVRPWLGRTPGEMESGECQPCSSSLALFLHLYLSARVACRVLERTELRGEKSPSGCGPGIDADDRSLAASFDFLVSFRRTVLRLSFRSS